MKYSIEHIKKTPEELKLLDELHDEAKVDYPLVKHCEYIICKNGTDKYYGAVAINLKKKLYPQFQHIILHPDASRGLAIKLIQVMEKWLKENGYEVYVAFVTNRRNKVQQYAQRLGMKAYDNNNSGIWFYKDLTRRF